MRLLNLFTYDKLKSRFQKFCDDTTLDGFKEMFYAKARAWTVIWFIAVFGAIGVTVFQVYRAILQFMDQSSVTQVSPIDPGGLMYPPLHMCYPHWIYWVDWDKAYSLNFTKESILYALSFTTAIFSETKFNISEAKTHLNHTMAANNIRTVTELLTTIAITFPMLQIFTSPLVMKNPPFFKTKIITWKTRSYFLCYTIEGTEIIKILQTSANSSQQGVRNQQSLFKFSVLDPDYTLYKSAVSYNEYNYYMSYWLCKYSNYWFDRVSDFFKNYTDFALPLQLYPDAHSDNYVEVIRDNDAYLITMTPTVHRWKSSGNAPCAEDQKSISSDNGCQVMCASKVDNRFSTVMYLDEAAMEGIDDDVDKLSGYTINFFQDIRKGDVNVSDPCNHFPQGTTENLMALTVPFLEYKYQYGNCCANCLQTCEVWKYSFDVATATMSGIVKQYTTKNETDVEILYPEEGDVMISIQIDAQTWEDFVGNVGGLLGVWTGASILSILQIFYLCCCIEHSCNCCHKYMFRRNSEMRMLKPSSAKSSKDFVQSGQDLDTDNRTERLEDIEGEQVEPNKKEIVADMDAD